MSLNREFEAMIGAEPMFRAALAQAAHVARSNVPVLIEGESGTGKGMLIRAMHAASPRAQKRLRILDLRAIGAESIERVLFGGPQGTVNGQAGAVQECDGGTLAIKGIHRLPGGVQERLVDLLAHGVVCPPDASFRYKVDVRVIAADKVPLEYIAGSGQLLPELLEMLAGVTISLPPLCERPGDVIALCQHFLARIGERPGLRQLGISDGALALLQAYDWPGNVRQLHDALLGAAAVCRGDALAISDFPQLADVSASRQSDASSQLVPECSEVMLCTRDGNVRPLEEIQADVIRLAICLYSGRISEIARRLGVSRTTLYRKLDDLGLANTDKAGVQ